MIGVLLTAVAYSVWLERKVSAHIQNRWGPTRVGPFGLLQPLADGAKFIFKEDLTQPHVYKPLYIAAPMIALVFAITSISVIPFGNWVNIGPWGTYLQITDVDIGLLVVLGITSMGVYGVALAGWASNNKYSLLGGLRASAQMISYEVSLGLSLVGVLIVSGSLSLRDIVDYQGGTFLAIHSALEYFSRTDARLFYLSDFGIRGNQPHAFRSARGGVGIGCGLSHRIQRHEVRHVLYGGVRQHGDGCLPGDAAFLGWMARADFWSADSAGSDAGVLVLLEGFLFYVSLRLGALDAATLSV